MNDANKKTIAVGVIIAGVLTLVYYAVPTNGISFGGATITAPTQTEQAFVPPLSAPPRGGGGCGV